MRTTLIAFSFFTLAGACGGKKEPAPDAGAATSEPTHAPDAAADAAPSPDAAPEPDCVPSDVQATLGAIDPDFAHLHGRSVEICGTGPADKEGADARFCVALDLDSGKRTSEKLAEGDVAHLPSFPAGIDEGLVKDDGRPVLKICPAAETRCKDLHVGQVLAAKFDVAKARVVVTGMEDGKLTAHLYDAATQAEIAVYPFGAADLPDCSFAAFVGDALLMSTGSCEGAGKSWLADVKTGAKLFDIGKLDNVMVKDGQYAQVEGNVWAFRAASGKAVYVQDIVSGEVSATVDLDKAADNTKAKDDHAFVFATPTELILVEARPLPGTVVTANRKDGAVTKVYVARPCQ